MKGTLRHAGIQVKDLIRAMIKYEGAGFEQMGPPETLVVLKMQDKKGQMIELVQGNWHPHIAVNWYDDGEGNYIEVVKDER